MIRGTLESRKSNLAHRDVIRAFVAPSNSKAWFTIIMTIVLCFVWYHKLPSGNARLKPESNGVSRMIASYGMKDYRHIVNQAFDIIIIARGYTVQPPQLPQNLSFPGTRKCH